MKKLAHATFSVQILVILTTVTAQIYNSLSAKYKKKHKRNLSFHYHFLMNYFNLHVSVSSNPISRLLNRMSVFLYLFFQVITCSFGYFPLITLFFHNVVSASTALLI